MTQKIVRLQICSQCNQPIVVLEGRVCCECASATLHYNPNQRWTKGVTEHWIKCGVDIPDHKLVGDDW